MMHNAGMISEYCNITCAMKLLYLQKMLNAGVQITVEPNNFDMQSCLN